MLIYCYIGRYICINAPTNLVLRTIKSYHIIFIIVIVISVITTIITGISISTQLVSLR